MRNNDQRKLFQIVDKQCLQRGKISILPEYWAADYILAQTFNEFFVSKISQHSVYSHQYGIISR